LASANESPDFDADDSAPLLLAVEETGTAKPETTSSKYSAPLLDTPQTISVFADKIIEEQNLLSLCDMLGTLPGIAFGADEGGGGCDDSSSLRGFSANTEITVDGMRESARYSRTASFNLEHLELVNGANSVHAAAVPSAAAST